jgi:hypothetical protein
MVVDGYYRANNVYRNPALRNLEYIYIRTPKGQNIQDKKHREWNT